MLYNLGRQATAARPRQPSERRMSIDRASPVPLHIQLKQALKDQILSGSWKAGDLVPGEPDLCREFRVSRTTVRQALGGLAYEGLGVREGGRGAFVPPPERAGG